MLLRAMTGSENWRNHSAKLHIFHSPVERGAREVHIGVAARDPANPITYTRTGQSFPAKPGYNVETGSWTDATFDVPAGEILKFFATKAGGFGAPHLQANLFVAMREDGPLHRVHMPLSVDPQARYSSVYIEGRYDILTYDQARILGAKVLPQFRKFSEPEITRRIFNVEVLEAATRPRPVMETRTVTVDAQVVNVAMRRRGRALQL